MKFVVGLLSTLSLSIGTIYAEAFQTITNPLNNDDSIVMDRFGYAYIDGDWGCSHVEKRDDGKLVVVHDPLSRIEISAFPPNAISCEGEVIPGFYTWQCACNGGPFSITVQTICANGQTAGDSKTNITCVPDDR